MSVTESIQKDWDNREILEIVQLKILDIVSIVNNFDQTVRSRLSTFHEKLTQIERTLQLCECSVNVSSTSLIMRNKAAARARADSRDTGGSAADDDAVGNSHANL